MAHHQPAAEKKGVIFFDVNETLLDTRPLKAYLARRLGNDPAIAEAWFTSLLHHSLVETVTGSWRSFGEIAEAVLSMTAERYGIPLSEDAVSVGEVLASMPPYDDVAEGLASLSHQGFCLAALTNSSADLAEKQLTSAGLKPFFTRILSVDERRIYKPDLRVYQWAMSEMGHSASACMMVAAHGWDVCGAKRAGMKTAFISREGQALYPLAPAPDLIVSDIRALSGIPDLQG